MPIHNFDPPRGRLVALPVSSRALEGNLLGDPSTRTVWIYLPQGYDETDADYPLFVGLAGFTGSGAKLLAWQSFGENLAQRLDRLVARGAMGPVVTALPDCFTSLGGNQYVDSTALGRWEEFLLEEMIPAIEARFRVRRDPRQRAVFGKSSGGYGALVHGLRHAERWGGVACHSGDIGFEWCYLRELPAALDVLAEHGHDPQRYLEHLRQARKLRGSEMNALMLLALSATYDPDPRAPLGIRLPVDAQTCELIDERWQGWLAHDPLRMLAQSECQNGLRSLAALFLDCGSRDPYALHYGARRFVKRLRELAIEHRYEEFDDNHSGVDYRMDVSLPFLYAKLAGR